MKNDLRIKLRVLALLSVLTFSQQIVPAGVQESAAQDIHLSPELLELLRAEMREVTAGVQGIIPLLATADWAAIAAIGEKIRASYIMEKSLTPEQAEELENALPDQFQQLDAEFHQRAEKLGAAAQARDAELVVFHYNRLLESCVRCHAAHAGSRFPGFMPPAPEPHAHGSE
jgi:cytochrome c556